MAAALPGGLASARCRWPCPWPRGESTPGLCYFSDYRNLCFSTMGSEISVFINHRLGMRVFSWECINPFSGMTVWVASLVNDVLLSLIAQQNKSFMIQRVVNSEAMALGSPVLSYLHFAARGGGSGLGEDEIDWEFFPTSWLHFSKRTQDDFGMTFDLPILSSFPGTCHTSFSLDQILLSGKAN